MCIVLGDKKLNSLALVRIASSKHPFEPLNA